MAIAKWSTPAAGTSIAGTALNSLANNATSAVMTFDNSTARNLYARVVISLGSISPTTGGSITLRYVGHDSGAEDVTPSLESYTMALTTTTSTNKVIVEMARLYPFADGFVLVNNSGAALNASGNTVTVIPYGEDIA